MIVDIRMPGIDGIETTRRLGEHDPASVIVLVTSADVRQYSALAESCGATALVPKQSLTPRLLRGLRVAHRQR